MRNVLAAGRCEIAARRRRYKVGNPTLYRDDSAGDMPAFIGFMFRRVLNAPKFLHVDVVRELVGTA